MPLAIQEADFDYTAMTAEARSQQLTLGTGTDTGTTNGPVYHGRVFLLKEAVGPARDLTLGDLVLADYDGAASQQVTWNAAVLDETGEPIVVSDQLTFVATGSATIPSNTIRAIAITGSDSVTLMGAVNLPEQTTVSEFIPLYLTLVWMLAPPSSPG